MCKLSGTKGVKYDYTFHSHLLTQITKHYSSIFLSFVRNIIIKIHSILLWAQYKIKLQELEYNNEKKWKYSF